jgi:hypothetical protein
MTALKEGFRAYLRYDTLFTVLEAIENQLPIELPHCVEDVHFRQTWV